MISEGKKVVENEDVKKGVIEVDHFLEFIHLILENSYMVDDHFFLNNLLVVTIIVHCLLYASKFLKNHIYQH